MIYIVRHGECTTNVNHVFRCKNQASDLTERGREQARLAGLWLADKAITRIITSPFDRTQQTAAIINAHLKLPAPVIADGLGEVDCGDQLEEASYDDGLGLFRDVFIRWLDGDLDAQFPGGEDFQTALDRFSSVVHHLDPGENPLLVTHGGISRAVVPRLCVNGSTLKDVRMLNNTGFALLEPDHIGRYHCDAWNLIEHLS